MGKRQRGQESRWEEEGTSCSQRRKFTEEEVQEYLGKKAQKKVGQVFRF